MTMKDFTEITNQPPTDSEYSKQIGNLELSLKVPQNLIDECELKSIETGNNYAIISEKQSNFLTTGNIEVNSDYQLKIIHTDSLISYPSMPNFYDTITKKTDLFERHKLVMNFLNSIDFKIVRLFYTSQNQEELLYNSFNNDLNYCTELAYVNDSCPNIIIRISYNLLIKLTALKSGSAGKPTQLPSLSPFSKEEVNKSWFFFYNPSQIIKLLAENSNTQYSRELKIKNILS